MKEEIEELKNDLYCQLFHQTDENTKIIVEEFYENYPELRDWIDKNRNKF